MDLAARRAQLDQRAAQLQERLKNIDAELDTHQSKDFEDSAVEREPDETLEGLGMSGMMELRRIDAALARMEAGTYGTCATCGTAISSERLDVLPATPFCKACAV